MSPERTFGTRGSYRFDETVPGVGRIRMKSGAKSLAEHHKRVALVRKLRDTGRLDLLRALKARELTVLELLDADRRNQLPQSSGDVASRRPLWGAATASIDAAKVSGATKRRYRVSWAALRAKGPLSEDATVQDLDVVDWAGLRATWGNSGSDWNHVLRAVSRFLTDICGSKWHPFRVAIIKRLPFEREVERVPDLSPAEFRATLAKIHPAKHPAIMTLAITGMRWGEFKRLTEAHLGRNAIQVPGTKTKESARWLPIDPSLMPWITAAVPCPFARDAVSRAWRKASGLRLHDLRHLTAQWLMDAGRPLTSIKAVLGHAALETTMRYARRHAKQEDAATMANILGNPQVDTQVKMRRVK